VNNVFYINVDPVIFRIGSLVVSWYGLMVALAVVTVVAWVAFANRKRRLISYDAIFMSAIVVYPPASFSQSYYMSSMPGVFTSITRAKF
jgi:prolipoprotein diacylglyceryltransferase